MNQTTSSTIELTTKDNQNHRSKVISKGKRSPQRVSSRPRSAKEQKDALEKIKLFRKRNKKLKKSFSNKITYIKEQKAEKTSTIKTLSKHQKQVNEKTDTKTKKSSELKPAKEQETETELESTTSTLDHYHEINTADQNDTATNTNSLSAIFTDDVTLPKTTPINKKKHSHALTNNDCPTTEDLFAETENNNNNKDGTNTKTDTFSTDTDTTTMTPNSDFITVTSDINELNTEDVDEDLKKNKCKWCSIISVIGGFILLCTLYNIGSKMLEEKCKQDIDIYLQNFSNETSDSVEKYFETFNEQNSDTKCKWLRKTKVTSMLEEKFTETHQDKIDTFFNKYSEHMTTQYQIQTKKETNENALQNEFLKNKKFYEEKIHYPLLAKYFQQKMSEVEKNTKVIPTRIVISGFEGEYSYLNGPYELYDCHRNMGYKPRYTMFRPADYNLYLRYDKIWEITIGCRIPIVIWENSADVLHPGNLGSQTPSSCKSDENIRLNNFQLHTTFFPTKI